MAIAQVNTEAYLNLAKAIKGLNKQSFWMSYDAEADVMYVNFSYPPKAATYSEAMDNDIIVRYQDEELIGITVTAVSSQ